MSVFAVGDIQGCYSQLRNLLDKAKFDPSADTLVCVGDLINRGPESLETLRFLKSLGSACQVVLGNHDFHFLSLFYGVSKVSANPTLKPLLAAEDADELAKWLRRQPLLIRNEQYQTLFCHAGIYPWWDLSTVETLAREVEGRLYKKKTAKKLLAKIYSNEPSRFEPSLSAVQRQRFTINALTRMRFVSPKRHLNLTESGFSGKKRKNRIPWFDVENPGREGYRVIFGHWSALGFLERPDIVSLDTGCVWGRALTMIKLRKNPNKRLKVFQQK